MRGARRNTCTDQDSKEEQDPQLIETKRAECKSRILQDAKDVGRSNHSLVRNSYACIRNARVAEWEDRGTDLLAGSHRRLQMLSDIGEISKTPLKSLTQYALV